MSQYVPRWKTNPIFLPAFNHRFLIQNHERDSSHQILSWSLWGLGELIQSAYLQVLVANFTSFKVRTDSIATALGLGPRALFLQSCLERSFHSIRESRCVAKKKLLANNQLSKIAAIEHTFQLKSERDISHPIGTPSLKLDLSSYSISLGNPVATSLAATKESRMKVILMEPELPHSLI